MKVFAIFAAISVPAAAFVPASFSVLAGSRLNVKYCDSFEHLPLMEKHPRSILHIAMSSVQQEAGRSISEEALRISKLLRSRPLFDIGVVGGTTCAQAFAEKVIISLRYYLHWYTVVSDVI